MKKVITLLFLCVSTFVCAQVYIETQVGNKAPQMVSYQRDGDMSGICGLDPTEPLVVASFSTNPPFSWIEVEYNEEGVPLYKAKGFNVDLITKAAQELKIGLRVKAYPTDKEALDAFHLGAIDAYMGSYYDPRFRQAGDVFVIPSYFQNTIGAVFMKDKSRKITAMTDLIGLKGVVRTDELFYNYIYLSLPKELTIEQVPDSRTAFTKLLKGEVDYILGSPYSEEAEARRFKMDLDTEIMPLPFPGQELFLVISGKSKCRFLQSWFSKYFKELKKDPDSVKNEAISFINEWGQRFKDDKGLMDIEDDKKE